ncbi:MAG: hypothetical protein ACO1SV_18290 [Fimbriimonas sp.]
MLPALLLLPFVAAPDTRIVLTPAMLLNETAQGDAIHLVDEQTAVGDPLAKAGIAPTKPFFPGWTDWHYPVHVAIDLGATHRVTKLLLYNDTGENPLVLSTGTPFKWAAKKISLGGYRQWTEVPVDAETRWLRITLERPSNVQELVLYGQKTGPDAKSAKPKGKRRSLPTMDELVGVNAFIDDPIDTIAAPSGIVREYHPWGWDQENGDRRRRFQPSAAAGGNSWFFDDYYAKLKAKGVVVAPVVWQSPEGVVVPTTKSREAKPIVPSADSEDPASYRLHANHLFQYAARYGSRKVDDRLLDLAPGQPRRSGLNLLRYLENWNEPDKGWEGREGRFNPYELAAMSSADYDGHLGKMGRTVGVKNADPNMRLVLGGLAGLNLEFIRAVKFWSDHHRGGHFPADVLNLHHYSSTGNEQGFQPNGNGISPEADRLREKMEAITDWRDAHLPDREVWLSEFGYDTNPASPLHAPALGRMSAEQVQAAWLVRAYLALAAARVDRAPMFMLRDVDSKGTGVFATCGIVREKGDWKPKPSWHHLVALRRHLKGMRFGAEVPSGRSDVRVYRFDGGRESVYAVWCPTSEDKRVTDFRLDVRGGKATVVQFADTDPNGISRPVPVAADGIRLDVSETPVLVRLLR